MSQFVCNIQYRAAFAEKTDHEGFHSAGAVFFSGNHLDFDNWILGRGYEKTDDCCSGGSSGLAWWTTFSSAVQKPAEYQSYLAEAQKNEKKGIYYDAILNYQKALEYHPENMDIYLKIAEAYKNLGDENGFIQACTQAMNLEGDGEQAVMILADYYLEKGQKGDAIALLQAQIQQQESNGSLGQS